MQKYYSFTFQSIHLSNKLVKPYFINYTFLAERDLFLSYFLRKCSSPFIESTLYSSIKQSIGFWCKEIVFSNITYTICGMFL